ncbi:L-carnitine dehydrogenase [Sphingopyxis sp. LC81]|uniref:thioesterase family protein n=1 Tax=Sphingopyxis sp. LC81 TaxID=1502850 RepID=UPI0005106B62|nr:thioesterase family protein [Sphingopyxis sp. LC81]KGB53073.1 L-carnitine dehydrogenase [Sphingopyxis sp. LC81]
MKEPPYGLETPNLDAPFDVFRGTVLNAWTDWNGHMNVGYYVVAFDHATGQIFNNLGLPYEYTSNKIGMYFVLEAHVNYVSEMKEGDGFSVRSQILDHDHKRVHLFHTMFAEDDGRLVATNELMLMNIDYASRRSAPWPDWAMQRIEAMAAAHSALPRPSQMGNLIAIRKS